MAQSAPKPSSARTFSTYGFGRALTAKCSLNPGQTEMALAIRFAVAASCLKHSILGDFNYVTREEVAALVGRGPRRAHRCTGSRCGEIAGPFGPFGPQ